MIENENEIAVVTLCNNGYVKYCSTLIKSFFYWNKNFTGDFIVMYNNEICGLSPYNIKYLESIYVNVKCIEVDNKKYAKLINNLKNNQMSKTYNVCPLKFEILTLNYDKLLFLDSDMLVVGNIMEIFDRDDSLCLVEDFGKGCIEKKRDNEYINSGFMYFGNRNYLNKTVQSDIINLGEKINFKTEYYFKGGKIVKNFNFNDQDIINVYFLDKNVTLLPHIYNSPVSGSDCKLTYGKNISQIPSEKILHFWTKPDITNSLLSETWRRYSIMDISYNEKIIITMTSWKKRIENIPTIINSILNNTLKPHKIIINLSSEEFPEKENEIPENTISFIEEHSDIIKINWVDGPNIKSWKKSLPTFKLYPNDCIICIDDDMIYPDYFIDCLWKKHIENPNNPITWGVCNNHGYWQHCGQGSLDKACYYPSDIYDYLNTDIVNYPDEDSFMTFMAVRNGNPPITMGSWCNLKPFNPVEPISVSGTFCSAYRWLVENTGETFEKYKNPPIVNKLINTEHKNFSIDYAKKRAFRQTNIVLDNKNNINVNIPITQRVRQMIR